MSEIRLIVALGNPGSEYEKTRHNAGWQVVDAFAKAMGVAWKVARKYDAVVAEVPTASGTLLLTKPQTFMNLSGQAVVSLTSFYKIPPEAVLVVHDDVAFEPPAVRLSFGGSSGGHKGVASVISVLGENFWRLRLGVGAKPEFFDMADWVLSALPMEVLKNLQSPVFTDTLRLILDKGPALAQNEINKPL